MWNKSKVEQCPPPPPEFFHDFSGSRWSEPTLNLCLLSTLVLHDISLCIGCHVCVQYRPVPVLKGERGNFWEKKTNVRLFTFAPKHSYRTMVPSVWVEYRSVDRHHDWSVIKDPFFGIKVVLMGIIFYTINNPPNSEGDPLIATR